MTEIQGKSILVRVSEGSSYWESTVTNTYRNHFLRPYENRSLLKLLFCSLLCFFFKALTISLSGLPKTKNAEVILKLKQMTLNRDLVAEVINMWVPFFMVLSVYIRQSTRHLCPFFNKLQCICCNLSASYFQAYSTEDQDRNVGAARKVSPDWSHKTMTCHSSNCFSIFWGQGNAPLVTSLPSSCYMTLPGNSGFEKIGF